MEGILQEFCGRSGAVGYGHDDYRVRGVNELDYDNSTNSGCRDELLNEFYNIALHDASYPESYFVDYGMSYGGECCRDSFRTDYVADSHDFRN